MQSPFPENDRFPAWKIAALEAAVAATFLVLLLGYWRIEITQHQHYVEQAERNRIRDLPVIAPRGRILDREGRVLVDNFPAFSILLSRENAAGLTGERLARLASGLGLDPDEVNQLVENTAHL